MKNILFSLIIGLCVFPDFSWAYSPPSGFILKKIASRRASARTFRVKSVVSRLEEGQAVGPKVKIITSVDLATHTLKSRAFTDLGIELYSIERVINVVTGVQKSNRAEVSAAVNALLFESSSESLIRVVRGVGIPIIQESDFKADGKTDMTPEERARLDKITLVRGSSNERGHELPKVYWALGVENSAAGKKSMSQSEQVWIEKDTFHLDRLLMNASAEDSALTEVQFEQTKISRDIAFPRLIKVNRLAGGKPETILQEEITDVATQVDLKADFKGTKTGWTDAGGALDDSVRDLIQNYYRYLR